jgi:hypothetical protein
VPCDTQLVTITVQIKADAIFLIFRINPNKVISGFFEQKKQCFACCPVFIARLYITLKDETAMTLLILKAH